MIQPTVDNFKHYRFVNCGSIMATGDKQQPISAKQLVLRDLPNEKKNTILRTPVSGTAKVLGLKRPQPSCPANENSGNLVYAHRKLGNIPGNINGNVNNCRKELKLQSPPSESIPKPINGLPVLSSNCSRIPTGISDDNGPERVPKAVRVQPGTRAISARTRNLFEERFCQLQMFLKGCDESKQEECIQRLRSVSAAERSMHAYELEKRAIQLALAEGKELHRMRILNVLGNAVPDENASATARKHSSATVVREEQQAS